jgi:hypothetical protein
MYRPGSAITRTSRGSAASARRTGAQNARIDGSSSRYDTGKPPPMSSVVELGGLVEACELDQLAAGADRLDVLRGSATWEPT